MKPTKIMLAGLILCVALSAKINPPAARGGARKFPKPDFILRDHVQKPRMVIGSNNQGQATLAIYPGTSSMNILSLSFSGNGKILAVGIDPGRVELWNVPSRKKIGTLPGGSIVALSRNGRLIAEADEQNYQRGVEIRQVPSGKLVKTIHVKPNSTDDYYPDALSFNPAVTLLDATLNGEDDTVYSVSTGKLVAVLPGTQYAQWSRDGAFLTGGDYDHLIVWKTEDWTKKVDLPNKADYVSTVSAFPEKDLVVLGGGKGARLLRLSTGKEIAHLGSGEAQFASFNPDGSLIFTETGDRFAVWDSSGKLKCSMSSRRAGVFAVSPDGRWLAASAQEYPTPSVMVWSVPKALSACGVLAPK